MVSYYYSSCEILEEKVYQKKVELIYRTGTDEECFMPYYRFFVELPEDERENGLKVRSILCSSCCGKFLFQYASMGRKFRQVNETEEVPLEQRAALFAPLFFAAISCGFCDWRKFLLGRNSTTFHKVFEYVPMTAYRFSVGGPFYIPFTQNQGGHALWQNRKPSPNWKPRKQKMNAKSLSSNTKSSSLKTVSPTSGARTARGHHLITRGAAIESVAPLTKVLTETEFYAFAEKAL